MTENDTRWYCQEGDANPTGPGTTDDLVNAIRTGSITKAARVSTKSDTRWTPITDVPAFAIAFRDASPTSAVGSLITDSDEDEPGLREPASPRPMFWAAVAITVATVLWETLAWVGTEHIRERSVSAAVDARLALYILVLPGLALVAAVGLAVVGLNRHARRKDWLLEREGSAMRRN